MDCLFLVLVEAFAFLERLMKLMFTFLSLKWVFYLGNYSKMVISKSWWCVYPQD
jgi:hypothetical protein